MTRRRDVYGAAPRQDLYYPAYCAPNVPANRSGLLPMMSGEVSLHPPGQTLTLTLTLTRIGRCP